MNLELEGMAVEMPAVAGHPNRLPFRGVLTMVGSPSRRAPSGARGHRVMLTRRATESALPSLLGMALDYAPALDAHDSRRKIGVITEAEIVPRGDSVRGSNGLSHISQKKGNRGQPSETAEGEIPQGLKPRLIPTVNGTAEAVPLQNNAGSKVDRRPGELYHAQEVGGTSPSADPAGKIAISGYLYAHDFPDVVDELRAGGGTLGMSYEITDAMVMSPGSPIWTVTSFTFTGAAVLRRERAAYPETWIEVR